MSTSENLRIAGIVLVVIAVLAVILFGDNAFGNATSAFITSITFLIGLIVIISSFFVSNNRSNTRQIKKIEHTNPLRHRKSLTFIKPKQLEFIKPKPNKKFNLH